MKTIKLFAAGAIALAALVPASIAAHHTIVVTGPPTLAAWSARVYRNLGDHLDYPTGTLGRYSTGVVAVKFNCSDTGAPAGIALYTSSGSRDLDQATLRALRHVATLHPLPDGITHDQRFIMRVLFAESPESAEQQIRKLRADAAKANAWFGKARPTIASTIDLAPPAG